MIDFNPESLLYVMENKSLAGKEDKATEGAATGRKLVVSLFEEGPDGFTYRVDQEGSALKPQLLSIAEILQSLGFALPPDPDRTTAETELLLEPQYLQLTIRRCTCTLVTEAPQVHVYSLTDEVDAEHALALELQQESRTNMVLARLLERQDALEDDETLERAWAKNLPALQGRAVPFLPALAAPPPAAGRGRGGRCGRGRGRG